MATYQVEISPGAKREIKDLPGHVRAQAIRLIRRLSENPRPPRSKALRGKPEVYRLWVAKRWRIVYSIEDDALLVLVLRVRLKEQIDYESV